jgi:hypothetical protein
MLHEAEHRSSEPRLRRFWAIEPSPACDLINKLSEADAECFGKTTAVLSMRAPVLAAAFKVDSQSARAVGLLDGRFSLTCRVPARRS